MFAEPSSSRPWSFLAVPVLLALTAACADQAGTPAGLDSEDGSLQASGGTLDGLHVTVCVDAGSPSGTYTYDRSADTDFGTFSVGSPFTLSPGDCVDVWQDDEETRPTDPVTEVTVEETGTPSGAVLAQVQFSDGFMDATTSGSSATVTVNAFHGGIITFVHEEEVAGGGEGCTPGYWRQPHHFDSWPSPFVPGDGNDPGATLLTDVFDVPSSLELQRPERSDPEELTLLEGVELRGGGVNALIRHAVAALLSAGSDDVSYDLTVSEVVAAFDAAVDGGDIQGTKDEFDELNNQGCPLN